MPAETHSDYGASSAHRWLNCPGSVALAQGLPDRASVYADEGAVAHHLAEVCLRGSQGWWNAADYMGWWGAVDHQNRVSLDVNKPLPAETWWRYVTEIDEGMVEAVQLYLDTVRADQAETPGSEMLVENRFALDWIDPDMFGTNDCALPEPWGLLRIHDYKHGAGHAVEADHNPQGLYYALGALGQQNVLDHTHVEIVIVQPRAYHKDGPVRRWRIPVEEVYAWADRELIPGLARAKAPDAPIAAGDWCLFCKARAVCPAAREQADEIARQVFSEIPGAPAQLDRPERLTEEEFLRVLEVGQIVKDWIRECYAYAHMRLERGEELPGWKLVAKQSRRAWRDEDRVKARAFTHIGAAIYEQPGLKSPAQMEKAFKAANLDPKLIEPLWEKKSTGVTMARGDDKRPAVAASALAGFGEINDGDVAIDW